MTYTEDALVEQPTINLFAELGWQTLDCYSETFGEDGLLGRDNRLEIDLICTLQKRNNLKQHRDMLLPILISETIAL